MLSVGVDIGGTKIAAGLVDEHGNILDKYRVETVAEDPSKIDADVIELVKKLSAGTEISGVGVACAGFISQNRDCILFAPNIAWKNYNMKAKLQEHLDCKVVIENDVNAAGWAEYKFGQGKNYSSMAMVAAGTGLGGAVIIDGKLRRGGFGVAGEFGHLKLVPDGVYCGCGLRGCWEAYASGTALVRNAKNLYKHSPQLLAKILEKGDGKITGPAITEAAFAHDDTAVQLLQELGWWLGYGACAISTVIDPELIVIGGGVSSAGDIFIEKTRQAYKQNLSASGHIKVAQIVVASTKNDAGIVGAADLVRAE